MGLEYRWSASDTDSMRKLARELVDLRPDVILTDTTPVTAAALRETRTIPVVFVQVGDHVGSGFVIRRRQRHRVQQCPGVTRIAVLRSHCVAACP